jgi:cold shock CspA family protein
MTIEISTVLGEKLALALKEKPLMAIADSKLSAKARQQPVRDSIRIESIPWNDELFGILQVGVDGFTLSGGREFATVSRSQINWEGQRPTRIQVFFSITKLAKGVRAFCLMNGKLIDVTESETTPVMWVNVEWRGVGKDAYPFTRQAGKDNFDIVLMRPEGFVMLQVSVTTRGNRFWLAVQDVYVGQGIMATREQLDSIGTTGFEIADSNLLAAIVPVTDEYGYPEANFVKSFGYAQNRILEVAADIGGFVPFKDSDETEWKHKLPPELPSEMVSEGWQRATVMWFNVVIGCGEVLTEKNERCFVHFSAIIDKRGRQLASKGEFPYLEPLTGVAVKVGRDKKGRRAATAVRKCVL